MVNWNGFRINCPLISFKMRAVVFLLYHFLIICEFHFLNWRDKNSGATDLVEVLCDHGCLSLNPELKSIWGKLASIKLKVYLSTFLNQQQASAFSYLNMRSWGRFHFLDNHFFNSLVLKIPRIGHVFLCRRSLLLPGLPHCCMLPDKKLALSFFLSFPLAMEEGLLSWHPLQHVLLT